MFQIHLVQLLQLHELEILESATIVVMLGILLVIVLNLSSVIMGEEEEVQELVLEMLEVVVAEVATWLT
jgi:hypothetical protein